MAKNNYPELVLKLINFCDAWIVGGAVNEESPKDYDVFVPIRKWQLASSFIPKDAKINRMGGFKCISEGKEVDVWTGQMDDFLLSHIFTTCCQPKYGIGIKRSVL